MFLQSLDKIGGRLLNYLEREYCIVSRHQLRKTIQVVNDMLELLGMDFETL